MEYIKLFSIGIGCLGIISCGKDVASTVKIKLRTDTFISSDSTQDNSGLNYLSVAKQDSFEKRIIVRLPTNEDDDKTIYDNCLNPDKACPIFLMPLAVLAKILTDCTNTIRQPQNLTSAILVFNTNDGSSIPAGGLTMNLLSKPWFHTTTWWRAHSFSSQGKWASPGGDTNNSVVFNSSCVGLSQGSCAAGEVKFEMTDYFKSLISAPNSVHYGLLIKANTTLSEANIYSVQAQSEYSPRIVATYTGSCLNEKSSSTKVYYLGESL